MIRRYRTAVVLALGLLTGTAPLLPVLNGQENASTGNGASPDRNAQGASAAGEAPSTPRPMSVKLKSQKKNQIRRLLQNSRLPQAYDVALGAYKAAQLEQDADMRAYAAWSLSVLEGLLGRKEECLEWFDRAIEDGWTNPYTFEYASLILPEIRNSPEFMSRVQKLRKAFEAERARLVEQELEAALESGADRKLRLPENLFPEGGYRAGSLEGRPALLIVTRMYHEGMTPTIESLNKIGKEYGPVMPVVVLFYQYFADDDESMRLTQKYVEHHGLELPYGIVSRDWVKPLKIPQFPTFFFLDARSGVLYRQEGMMDADYLTSVLDEVIRATGARAIPEPAPEPVHEAVETAPGKVEAAVDAVRDTVSEPTKAVNDAVERTAEEAPGETVSKTVQDAVTKTADQAADTAKDVEEVPEKVPAPAEGIEEPADGIEELEQKIEEAGDATEAMEDAAESVKTVEESVETVEQKAAEAIPETPTDKDAGETAEKKVSETPAETGGESTGDAGAVEEKASETPVEVDESTGGAEADEADSPPAPEEAETGSEKPQSTDE